MVGLREWSRLAISVAAVTLGLAGCSTATYKTPGSGVNVGSLATGGGDLARALEQTRAIRTPARLAVARTQAVGYGGGVQCIGQAEYCVLLTRDIESEADFNRLGKMRGVSKVVPLTRIVLGEQPVAIQGLRAGAAAVKADVLLVYSIDTRFSVDDTQHQALTVVTLGFLATKRARVDTTASAALVDVRTGSVLGLAEAVASDEQMGSAWSTEGKLETARLTVEKQAFQQLLGEIDRVWSDARRTKANAG